MTQYSLALYVVSQLFFSKHIPETQVVNLPKKNCFGVFVTIRRSTASPKDDNVHGCIGYWSPNYQDLSRQDILKHAVKVGYSALYEDDRRLRWSDITQDSHAVFEVDLMMKPLETVDQKKGMLSKSLRPFDNKIDGLIASTGHQRATYLPGVFSNASWTQIRDSLYQKGQFQNSDITYVTYPVLQERIALIDTIYALSKLLTNSFLQFLTINIKTKKKLPYGVKKNGQTYNDVDDNIRKIGLLKDITEYLTKDNNMTNFKSLHQHIQPYIAQYTDKWVLLDNQSLSFLLPLIPDVMIRRQVCRQLKSQLHQAERMFAFSEITKSLLQYCYLSASAQNQLANIYKTTKMSPNVDFVFQWNWDVQAIQSLPMHCTNLCQQYENYILKWAAKYLQCKNMETNYLAVLFEGLSFLRQNYTTQLKTDNIILEVFREMTNRYTDGYYVFLNQTARLDITCHFLNGLNQKSDMTEINNI